VTTQTSSMVVNRPLILWEHLPLNLLSSFRIGHAKLDMEPLRIFLTTWNTGLQGSKAQSQDLSSWLLPVLHKSTAESDDPAGLIPDLYAIAVQELLPVHLARGCNSSDICHGGTYRT